MNVFILIDGFIGGLFEKFAHFIERLLGWNCFKLARVCMLYVAFFAGALLFVGYKSSVAGLLIMSVVVSIMFYLGTFVDERITYESQKKGGFNPRKTKTSNIIMRLGITAIFIYTLFKEVQVYIYGDTAVSFLMFLMLVLLISYVAAWPAAFYFCSCDPLRKKPAEPKSQNPA